MPTIKVNGMHCANCKKAVEQAVKAIPGVKTARADLDKKELEYEEDDAGKPIAQDVVMDVIRDLGFEPESPRP